MILYMYYDNTDFVIILEGVGIVLFLNDNVP